MRIQDTCVNLLIIFGKNDFRMFLMCQGKVSLSTCPFLIFRFYVYVIPHGLYIYIYGFWSGFIWFLWNMQRYKHIILLSSSQLVTNVFFKNWSKISQAFAGGMQFGNNWSLTSTQKTKDRATRTPLKPGVNTGAPEGSAFNFPAGWWWYGYQHH